VCPKLDKAWCITQRLRAGWLDGWMGKQRSLSLVAFQHAPFCRSTLSWSLYQFQVSIDTIIQRFFKRFSNNNYAMVARQWDGWITISAG
jgi:hypothetical protein